MITDTTHRTGRSVFKDTRVGGFRDSYVSAFSIRSKQSLQRLKRDLLTDVELEILEKLQLSHEHVKMQKENMEESKRLKKLMDNSKKIRAADVADKKCARIYNV